MWRASRSFKLYSMNWLQKLYNSILFSDIHLGELLETQKGMFVANTRKHLKVFVLSVVVAGYVLGVEQYLYPNSSDTILNALFGILFISGTAWFAISFGAVPERFGQFAIKITTQLFSAFTISLFSVLVTACLSLPWLSPVFVLAFLALYCASVRYDIMDGLKLGVDETVFQQAKLGKIYFGQNIRKEDEVEGKPKADQE